MIARLTDPWFEAHFIRQGDRHLTSIEGAQGICLFCPCGFGRPDIYAHGLIVPFTNAPDHNFGVRARDGASKPKWAMTGTGLGDLSLTPSIDVGEPSCWHGYITNGEVL